MAVVVDTDVVSYVRKGDTRAHLYVPHLTGTTKLISFMTLAELRRWALQNNWGLKRRQELENFLLNDYGVIYADDDLCGVWAQVMNQARKTGRPIATADAWIAATALWHGIPLVSHDADFSGIAGLQLVTET